MFVGQGRSTRGRENYSAKIGRSRRGRRRERRRGASETTRYDLSSRMYALAMSEKRNRERREEIIGVCVLGDALLERREVRIGGVCVCEKKAWMRGKHCENDRTKEHMSVVESGAWVERRQIGKDENGYGGCERIGLGLGGEETGDEERGRIEWQEMFLFQIKEEKLTDWLIMKWYLLSVVL